MYTFIIDMITTVNIILAIEFCIIAYGVFYITRAIVDAQYGGE